MGAFTARREAVTLQLKGLPLAYNKDMQETQEPAFSVELRARDAEAGGALYRVPWSSILRACTMRRRSGYLNAMAAATYLVHKGVPFRTAHEKIGNAVRFALEKGVELGDLTLEELRQFGAEFGEDFYPAVTLNATLDCHDVIGGTAHERVKRRACKCVGARRCTDRLDDPGGCPCWCVRHCFRTPPMSTTL